MCSGASVNIFSHVTALLYSSLWHECNKCNLWVEQIRATRAALCVQESAQLRIAQILLLLRTVRFQRLLPLRVHTLTALTVFVINSWLSLLFSLLAVFRTVGMLFVLVSVRDRCMTCDSQSNS
jgi:hypothetical protein